MATINAKTDFLENAVLNLMRGTSITAPAGMFVGLFPTGAPPTESSYSGEVAGNGYNRKSIVFTAPSGGIVSNTAQILFDACTPAGWGDMGYFGIFDAASGGNMWYYGQLDAVVTLAIGDQFKFAAGALQIQEL